ncbi:N-acetyllactosaminide alpha-1,3-galactosyltransferase-like [Discoglossus pictus]
MLSSRTSWYIKINMFTLRRFLLIPAILLLLTFLYWESLICHPGEPAVTPWGAPIVWEGTFNSEKDEHFHQERGTVVGLSVFAIGKYLPRYLLAFLLSANQHFMRALPCVLYVLTDQPSLVPAVPLRPGLSLVILRVPYRGRWQDISMMRMHDLREMVIPLAEKKVDYLFCMDVDQVFTSRYGPETLGDLVAQLHSGYYLKGTEQHPYERSPTSMAFIPPEKWHYYYHAAVFAGTPARLANLTSSCLRGILTDKMNGVEAVWQDESHLNRYLTLEDLPTKVLSPEYCWDRRLWLKYHRLQWLPKDYKHTRV